MAEATAFYKIQRYIADTDVDFARRMKPASMFGFFQDIAALHAANLGASVDWLHDELGVAWILMRIRVEIDKYPVLAQEVTVETWPQTPRALYERDYVIRDMDGGALVRAASTWVIMDLAAREIKRDGILDYLGIEMRKERALGTGVARLRPVPDALPVYEKSIKYSDIDYNTHVNNGKYVDFILDCFPFEEHQSRSLKAMEVHYVNEIGPESVLQLRRKTLEDGRDYVDGILKPDGGQVISALVEWA